MRRKFTTNSQQGLAIVLLMIILIVATAIGIWGLTSSRNSMLRAGSRKFTTELTYQAEQGLQKAVRRIQAIATGEPDQVATTNANDSTAGKTTSGTYQQKVIGFLITTIGQETTYGSGANPACPAFDSIKDFDYVTNNVVCNFLGVVDANNQVTIVRKNDLTVGASDTFAIYLVNSIATDSGGRKQAIQGVVVVPYSGTASNGTPYLASSKAVTD